MADLPTVILKPGKEQSLLRFHPWLFSGAVKHLPTGIMEGDLVRIISASGQFLGTGHFQLGTIAVRILTFKDVTIDHTFWVEKIRKAWEVRNAAGLFRHLQNNTFRLVNGEGDGLPGLIIDFYGGVAVMQMHSIGMYRTREELVKCLHEVLGDLLVSVYDKSAKTLPFKAGLTTQDSYLGDPVAVPHEVLENGLRFRVDWETGQKTGFFIDQRENRRLVEAYAMRRHVLNMFCYTGGFSVYALRGGALTVDSVDSSQKAVGLTAENAGLNFTDDPRHHAIEADAFEFLKEVDGKYDLIILDPPAFAKHQEALPNALKAYKRMNAKALQQINPDGILFTFSCSQIVSREKFREAVFSAAAISGRNVRILHQLTQPADHPVNIYHPEGEYLKGLVLFVE